MRAHLRQTCGVVGEEDVPSICRDMALSWRKAEGLVLLSQFFLTGMIACLSEFHGHADLLHISFPLFNFFTRGEFTNHINHTVCRLGRISGWTPLKVLGGRNSSIVSTLAEIGAQDSCLVNADNLACGSKITLSVIVDLYNLCRKLVTFCYKLTGLFG